MSDKTRENEHPADLHGPLAPAYRHVDKITQRYYKVLDDFALTNGYWINLFGTPSAVTEKTLIPGVNIPRDQYFSLVLFKAIAKELKQLSIYIYKDNVLLAKDLSVASFVQIKGSTQIIIPGPGSVQAYISNEDVASETISATLIAYVSKL